MYEEMLTADWWWEIQVFGAIARVVEAIQQTLTIIGHITGRGHGGSCHLYFRWHPAYKFQRKQESLTDIYQNQKYYISNRHQAFQYGCSAACSIASPTKARETCCKMENKALRESQSTSQGSEGHSAGPPETYQIRDDY